jgi:hypothetical protein
MTCSYHFTVVVNISCSYRSYANVTPNRLSPPRPRQDFPSERLPQSTTTFAPNTTPPPTGTPHPQTSLQRPPQPTMNNSQFRQLISGSSNQQNGSSTPRAGAGATPVGAALGTKKTSFVPMTPRAISGSSGNDFARQVRERNAGLQPNKTKKFKSYTPKGVKLGAGYTDRAKARAEGEGNEDAEDKAERVKALEEQMKLGQISQEMFEALRDKITGGDAASSHLVKGLDWKLLERVRRGEDVMGTGEGTAVAEEEQEPAADVDDELEKLGEVEVEALKKEKVAKKGNMAPPPPVAGKKRSRDEIMAELKAQRQAAAEARKAAEPQLGDRWQKVSDKKKPKIEIDSKGREVLITVDENGVVKKRVRKQQIAQTEEAVAAMGAPDASKAVLGADVSIPEPSNQKDTTQEPADDDDDDIFEGVGTDYNPLGNMPDDDDDDDDSDSDGNDDEPPRKKPQSEEPSTATREQSAEDSDQEAETTAPATSTAKPTARRNYFNDTISASEESHDHLAGIQEVLKKAAKMDPLANENEEEDRVAREAKEAQRKKHAQMLANQDRDLDDMDMGFGGSRNDDEGEDEDGMKVKLAEWKGGRTGDDGWEEDDGKGGGREKRKRKPKKRKGDTNNMSDIMRVIEGRKGDAKK